jgi:hypothetical protein
MLALTVKQPWAWAIVHAHKGIENRSWATRHRGALLIHAGQTLDWGGWTVFPAAPSALNITRGAIIGQVELVDCVREHRHPQAEPGQWHWVLAHPVVFEHPIPYRGTLGLWTPKGLT